MDGGGASFGLLASEPNLVKPFSKAEIGFCLWWVLPVGNPVPEFYRLSKVAQLLDSQRCGSSDDRSHLGLHLEQNAMRSADGRWFWMASPAESH